MTSGLLNNKKKRIVIVIGLFLTLITTAIAGYLFYFTNQSNQVQGMLTGHKKINILLLGINQRKNDIGRSNVTCVVTVDTDTKDVSMLWIPRDSRVRIPGYGWNKIGHAYAYGGTTLSKQTVSEFLGIPIDYYVAVNMSGFQKVIDALGGVDIDVDKRMYYYDPYDEGEIDNNGLIDIKPGMQHMDGSTALQYVRFRHDELGDIGRIARQQKFAKAMLADIITPSIITRIPSVIKEASSVFTTDMPTTQMMSLSKVITDAYKQGLNTDIVNGKPIYIDEISYWLPDIVAMRKQVAEIQGFPIDDQYLNTARDLANTYEASVPPETKIADAPSNSVVNDQPVATNKSAVSNSKPKNAPAKTNNQSSTDSKSVVSPAAVEVKNQSVQQNNPTNTTGK